MLSTLDLVLFFGFAGLVVCISLWAARGQRTREDYFLAGRALPWWMIGISLIASNISTEHFVGMSGNAAKNGLAVASWEWISAVALVVVGAFLLPHFLKRAIYTIPEYLELRFDRGTRLILAALTVLLTTLALLATVVYSGAQFLSVTLELPFNACVWGLGLTASLYTVLGGLKAVVWSDLVQGLALLIGGAFVSYVAFDLYGDGSVVGGFERLFEEHGDSLHLAKPVDDSELPWPGLFTGIWIPVLFYWGLNQFITQRTLAAGSLAQGQRGILLAAAIKLLLPLLVVFPGLIALDLIPVDQHPTDSDGTYPTLLKQLLPEGLLGLMLAAVTGAILSSFNSGLNSAATVFTLDLWPALRGRSLNDDRALAVGRWTTVALTVFACVWAPIIREFDGVFAYIQELWGYVSIPTCAVFFCGLRMKKVDARAARVGLVLGPLLYFVVRAPKLFLDEATVSQQSEFLRSAHAFSSLSILYHMAGIFLSLVALMAFLSRRNEPVVMPDQAPEREIDLTPMRGLGIGSFAILAVTVWLYVVFW
ncbi:MAG: solute:sodium symporter family transporter [Planctomycetota bacterium]